MYTMRFREAKFEVEKDEEAAVETEVQTMESLEYIILVQNDYMKAVWQEAKQNTLWSRGGSGE